MNIETVIGLILFAGGVFWIYKQLRNNDGKGKSDK